VITYSIYFSRLTALNFLSFISKNLCWLLKFFSDRFYIKNDEYDEIIIKINSVFFEIANGYRDLYALKSERLRLYIFKGLFNIDRKI